MIDEVSENLDVPGIKDFNLWLIEQPYWLKYLWWLHMEGREVNDEDINKCYKYLLEDSGIIDAEPGRPDIVLQDFDLDGDDSAKDKISLDKLDNLNGVNAIDNSCVLEFGKNLTIVYGDNGSGKSGIGRLLSNACLSRKQRKLLPDARNTSALVAEISADFQISDSSDTRIINYKLGQNHEELKSFSIFDHECAPIHLDGENKIEFIPSKLKIFDEVLKDLLRIEGKFQEDIRNRKKDNPVAGLFQGQSPLAGFLGALSYETTDNQIDDAIKFTPEDSDLLAEKQKDLAQKIKKDVAKQKEELAGEIAELRIYKSTLGDVVSCLSGEKASIINKLVEEIRNKKEIADKLSAASFKFESFKNIGSHEWKSLILAAQKLYDKETIFNGGEKPAFCLLCQQPLSSKEESLFQRYWDFLGSTAEEELKLARINLSQIIEKLRNDNVSWPKLSSTESAVKILERDMPEELQKIREVFKQLHIQLSNWIAQGDKGGEVKYTSVTIDLEQISTLIDTKSKIAADLTDPAPEIEAINRDILQLENKRQVFGIIDKIKEYVVWLRWQKSSGSINLPAFKAATTRKQKEIMERLVVSRYVEIFIEETKELDCKFGLRVKTHGREASTVKGLKLDFADKYSPGEILSEGEQTVSALADFLTESRLNKNNFGIIFDDPVTSLDHGRRSVIAKRLVKEAKDRQVIIFTHDIVFLLDLQNYADIESVDCVSKSMRRNVDKIGIINPDLPWIALDVKKKVGYIKNKLPILKKAESGDQDEYRDKVKLIYELLREAWERAVEERLFKKVVQRFDRAVHTQMLDDVEVTPELKKEIKVGMSESSNWLHDMAAGLNPTIPTSSKVDAEVKLLDDFIAKCKA
ncbi:MAG: AAA family ATPase [Candidatus Falkowbacteria bacterium]